MGHYFSENVAAASRPGSVELKVPGLSATLATDRGVFSADQVDAGSRYLLIDGPSPSAGDRVIVDVGAGYGPIALTQATRNPDATVWAVEVNDRARALTQHNAESLGLTNVKVVHPDEVPADLAVDRIWSNPPIRIGKKSLHQLLNSWLSRLTTAGSAHLVVQKNLGADSLASWLDGQGYQVERRSSHRGYRLLDVRRTSG